MPASPSPDESGPFHAALALEHDAQTVGPSGIEDALAALRHIAEAAERGGDRMVLLNALRVTAGVKEAAGSPDAFDAWVALVETRGDDEADPFELATVARYLFRLDMSESAEPCSVTSRRHSPESWVAPAMSGR